MFNFDVPQWTVYFAAFCKLVVLQNKWTVVYRLYGKQGFHASYQVSQKTLVHWIRHIDATVQGIR